MKRNKAEEPASPTVPPIDRNVNRIEVTTACESCDTLLRRARIKTAPMHPTPSPLRNKNISIVQVGVVRLRLEKPVAASTKMHMPTNFVTAYVPVARMTHPAPREPIYRNVVEVDEICHKDEAAGQAYQQHAWDTEQTER
ncbi:uncharacterized protein KY384_008898 [Bacidia gigantensis]|uniref:uncharacterized protein n=1 Tax=Bacidia gigantensis TaxID=2732470 RepID=UPI001D044E0A|nr:uncharacterized protein KY384_008898 [Bacidia gigantensis]KAG8525254.1 hypothetical protein KY384_008898 [Bacidia gigantensis]